MEKYDTILKILEKKNTLDLICLVRESKFWINDVLSCLDCLLKKDLIRINGKYIYLTGHEFKNTHKCNYKKFNIPIEYEKCFIKFKKIRNEFMPKPISFFEQFNSTAETSLKRYLLAKNNNDIENKKILFFGDDDFTSIIFSLSGKYDNLLVIDIDKRITDSFVKINKNYGLDIDILNTDYRYPIRIKEKYDVFFIDPPPNINTFKTIISRIDEMGSRKPVLYLSLADFLCPAKNINDIINMFKKHGFVLKKKINNFNEYENSAYIKSYTNKKYIELLNKFGYKTSEFINSHPFMSYAIYRFVRDKKIKIKTTKGLDIYSNSIYQISN